ncbi:MAG: undecaprenyl-phosphate galactose phosphotransferase WbaP [Schwartzia sp.]|nr:undecaprenyl-phosphate galactose phosphotransferase WbaP [Schwartzia sp. (in: firmicutes)]
MRDSENREEIRISCQDRYSSLILPVFFLCLDYLGVVGAELLAYVLRRDVLPNAAPSFFIPEFYLYIVVPTIFLCVLYATGAPIRRAPFWRMAQSVFRSAGYSVLILTMLMYFGKVGEVFSRLFVGMTGLFAFPFLLCLRYAGKTYINRHGLFQEPVLFVGAGRTAELVLRSLGDGSAFGYRVVGFIDDHPVSETLGKRFPILGGFDDIEPVIRETGVQTVIITAPGLSPERQVRLVNRIQPLVRSVTFIPDYIGTPLAALEVETLLNEKIILLKVKNNLARRSNRAIKRIFDLVVSLCGMVVVVPLGIFLGLAIFLDSPGPVIFAHRRIGQGGREFPCYKFRSMVPDAPAVLERYLAENPAARAEWERDFKLRNDPRVTRVGAFLRRTSLDELPQLWNVIRGEMSLVGPRPIVRAEIAKYGDYIQDFYLVPPGITGMWQVNGRSDTTYEERVAMDSWYVRNWSVWIDMVYLLKTVKVVFDGRGAY